MVDALIDFSSHSRPSPMAGRSPPARAKRQGAPLLVIAPSKRAKPAASRSLPPRGEGGAAAQDESVREEAALQSAPGSQGGEGGVMPSDDLDA